MRMISSWSARAAPKAASRFSSPVLPLDYFLNKAKALSLYRSFIRATRGLGDHRTRFDTVQWIRADFERNRHVVDSSKTLLGLGNRQLKQLNSTGMLVGSEGDKWRGMRKV
ncbi:hypothetical protein MNV49_006809 [Pseudohyphozyma bogoriensis]|nr:hypothetical protein MNV49_006809 [Pseudohyphozyma bogoriensis]